MICRRILQRHHLSEVDFQSEKIKPLICKLSGKNQSDKFFKDEFVETEAVQDARFQYLGCTFQNRCYLRSCYFDSPAYKRSKMGNCYVFFKEAEQEKCGKIQYFIRIPGSPYFNAPVANVRSDQKIFFFPTQLKSEEIVEKGFIIKLCKTFEHS